MSCAPPQNKSYTAIHHTNSTATKQHLTPAKKQPVQKSASLAGKTVSFSIANYLKMIHWTAGPMDRNAMLIELATAALAPRSRNHAERFQLASETLNQIEVTHLERTMIVACCLRVTRMLEKVAIRGDASAEERAFALKNMLPFQIQLVKNAVGQALKDRVFSGMYAALGLRLRVTEDLRERLDCHFYRSYALKGQSDLALADKMSRLVAEAETVAAYYDEQCSQSEVQLILLQVRCLENMAAKIAADNENFQRHLHRIQALMENLPGQKAAA